MEILANDLSIHRQFANQSQFRESVRRILEMRAAAWQWNRDIQCTREMSNAEFFPEVPMGQAVQQLDEAPRRAFKAWLDRAGPFWEERAEHGESDWLESEGEIVTESALAEVAYRQLFDRDAALASFIPSDWHRTPVPVTYRTEDAADGQTVLVDNCWDVPTLVRLLKASAPPIASWQGLQDVATQRFSQLHFAASAFNALEGLPFAKSAASRLVQLFKILNELAGCFDSQGKWTAAGHEIKAQHFSKGNANFSDESQTNKRKFEKQLTFRHPKTGESALFGWHGKIRTHTIRFHFSWPVRANEPVYVVYVGQKITK